MDEGRRVLAVDWGEKRIGLAISDPRGVIGRLWHQRGGEGLLNGPVQGGLVGLDDEEIMPALGQDLLGHRALGYLGIGGDDHAPQIDASQQGRDSAEFAVLVGHRLLSQHGRIAMAHPAD